MLSGPGAKEVFALFTVFSLHFGGLLPSASVVAHVVVHLMKYLNLNVPFPINMCSV